ncbi:hypothetical protein NC796_17530 [Aliifodinibius sp. S!AR15-10]|nr:hypothetical protein [Aliifodinibius sp. S!AR15-10]
MAPSITAIEFLKETQQYRKQLQICLKNFSGRTAETFRPDFVEALRTLYQDHLIYLGKAMLEFAEGKINHKKTLDVYFSEGTKTNPHYSQLIESLSNTYGEEVLKMKDHPWTCRRARIPDCSKDIMNRLEGKLRIIGQFACLEDAISFLNIRIGLHGKYTYKSLVGNLDELIQDFLIDSSTGDINQVKAQQPVDELVREAANKYEVLNAPIYLVNPEAYKSILRHRIKTTLKKV